MTVLNKRYVQRIFGTEIMKDIFIPTLINDYNCKMGGVNFADQQLHTINQTCNADAIGYQCPYNHWASFGAILTLSRNHTTIKWATHEKCKRTNSFSST